MLELCGDVPPVAARGAGVFFLGHTDLGLGEVGEALRMVGVALCQDDVTHVGDAEAEIFNPENGGVGFVELEARHVDQRLPLPFDGIPHVEQAGAGVDQGSASSPRPPR